MDDLGGKPTIFGKHPYGNQICWPWILKVNIFGHPSITRNHFRPIRNSGMDLYGSVAIRHATYETFHFGTPKTSNNLGMFMDFLQQIQLNIGQKVCKHKEKWTKHTVPILFMAEWNQVKT